MTKQHLFMQDRSVMVRSGFQFANPMIERVSFVTNNKFDSDNLKD